MNDKKELKKLFVFDWKILAAVIFLMTAGAIAVYSSTYSPESGKTSWMFLKFIFFCATWICVFTMLLQKSFHFSKNIVVTIKMQKTYMVFSSTCGYETLFNTRQAVHRRFFANFTHANH